MDNFEFENRKRKKLKRGPICVLLSVICLIVGSCGGYFFHDFFQSATTTEVSNIYSQVAEIVESDFLDTTDSDTSLQERMLYGMIGALGDPHSSYMNIEQAQDLGTTINGSFKGIGITFSTVDAGALVLDVYQNTPAQKAGLLAGDVLTHVQGTSIAGYASDKIKSIVQGESGTDVKLRLIRNGKSMDFTVTRGSVETSVAYEIRHDNQNNIGYLRITTFGSTIASVIENALKDFQLQGVDTLVIDLRGNGGGYLDAAKGVLDLFVPQGEIMFRVQPYQGKEIEYKANHRQKYEFKNGFILVDGESASASEVITGALKEVCGYKVIGTKTYGKGTVQTQKSLTETAVLKYTYAKWLTPKGQWVHGEGIIPDYEVNQTTIYDFHIVKMETSYQYDQVDNHIAYMQEMLKELGYSVDRTDGYFSLKTQNALKTFEQKYGLKVDGIYDKNDATILLSALGYHIYQELEDNQYQKIIELIK